MCCRKIFSYYDWIERRSKDVIEWVKEGKEWKLRYNVSNNGTDDYIRNKT
jgi:hypothetical protein